MNHPFFSVIIPTYNRAHLILRAVNSVLDQTFKNYELIIADDCSTDNTEHIIRELNNPNIKFFKNNINIGNAGARNLGVRNAIGTYVSFVDSDDCLHHNFLERMFDLIETSDYPGFLWSDVNRIDSNGIISEDIIPPTWQPLNQKKPYEFFLKGLFFGTGYGLTIRRDCFKTTGYFDEQFRTAVDTDFILRIVQDFNFYHTQEILVDTYDHDGERVRKNTLEKLKSYKILIKKHKTTIHKNSKLQQVWYYKLMWLSYHSGQKKDARRYLITALSAGKIKSLLTAGIFEFFPKSKAISMHKKISEIL